MLIVALVFLLILAFLFRFRQFPSVLIVYFVLYDMVDGFYADQKIYAVFRYLIPLLLLLYYTIRRSAWLKSDGLLLVVVLYLICLLFFSRGEMIASSRNLFSVLITLFMIPVGRSLSGDSNWVRDFQPFNRFLLIVLPLYIFLANRFGFGESYTEAFTTGYLITSRFYIFPIVIFFALHYLLSNQVKSNMLKLIDIGFIFLNVGIIVLNTRRTALAMLVLALLIYVVINRRALAKAVFVVLASVITLILTFPVYEDILMTQLEKRQRILDVETYDEERRYLETIYIYNEMISRQRPTELFFGVKLFDTYSFGAKYFNPQRSIHSDINMMFYSTGLVGMLLFGLLLYRYFGGNWRAISKEGRKLFFPMLAVFFLVIIPGRLIGTLTFAPLLFLVLSASRYMIAPQLNSADQ